MNRTEAIEILENGDFWDLCVVPYVDSNKPAMEFHDALDMAIAAFRAQQEPNDPLTLEELREMDGEPMWVVIAGMGRYAVIQHCGEWSTKFTDGMEPPNGRYGTYWLACRRRLEEPTP